MRVRGAGERACLPRAAAADARTAARGTRRPRRRAAPSRPARRRAARRRGRARARSGRAQSRETTCVRGGRVAAGDRHARLGDAAVELEHVVELGRPPETASVTTSASGSAPDAARSLRLTAAARQPRSRHDDPVEPEVHALDERVLRHDEPAARAAPRRARRPRSGRAARARRAGRAHRPARASSTARRSAGIRRRADHRDAGGAGADARGGVRRVDAADRHDRRRHRGADARAARRGRAAGRRRPSTASPRSGPTPR